MGHIGLYQNHENTDKNFFLARISSSGYALDVPQ